MRWERYGFAALLFGVMVCGSTALAQSASAVPTPPVGLVGEFSSLAGRAATIFVGQVISIERHSGATEIVFNVEQTVLGDAGAQYTLREWAGLWPQGQYRYTVGQRALVFLHGASAAGFGSPVDGAEGVVPVIVQGANAPELLDVRRLSAALLRNVGTPLPTETNAAIRLSDALPLIAAGLEASAGRLPRPEPVRLPMPVHSGVGGGGIQGTTGGNAGFGAAGGDGALLPAMPLAGSGAALSGSAELTPHLRPAATRVVAGASHETR